MRKQRLLYLFALLACGCFLVFFDGYFSAVVWMLILLLPLFSFLVSLPALLSLRFSLSCGKNGHQTAVQQGESVQIILSCKALFPGAFGKAVLETKNTFTGEVQTRQILLPSGRAPVQVTWDLSAKTCGLLQCRVKKVKLLDLSGLFALPGKTPLPLNIYVLPKIYPLQGDLLFGAAPHPDGERFSPTRPGPDPGETYDIRPYTEGDKLSRIHWKLSQKEGRLLVREGSLPLSSRFLLWLRLSGNGSRDSLLLDSFSSLSLFFLQQGISHTVWYSGRDGLSSRELSREEELTQLLFEVLAYPNPTFYPPEKQAMGISQGILLGDFSQKETYTRFLPGAVLLQLRQKEDTPLPSACGISRSLPITEPPTAALEELLQILEDPHHITAL
jgi:uncharacterized protein (DUF58 family)